MCQLNDDLPRNLDMRTLSDRPSSPRSVSNLMATEKQKRSLAHTALIWIKSAIESLVAMAVVFGVISIGGVLAGLAEIELGKTLVRTVMVGVTFLFILLMMVSINRND